MVAGTFQGQYGNEDEAGRRTWLERGEIKA